MATEPTIPRRCGRCRGFRFVSPAQAHRFLQGLAREWLRRAGTPPPVERIRERVQSCECSSTASNAGTIRTDACSCPGDRPPVLLGAPVYRCNRCGGTRARSYSV